jgi:hypothetical protein
MFPLLVNAQILSGIKKWNKKLKTQKIANRNIETIQKTNQFGNFFQSSQNQNFNNLNYLGFGFFNNYLKLRTLKKWELQSERSVQIGIESGPAFENPGGTLQYFQSKLWLKSPEKAITFGPTFKLLLNGRSNPAFQNNSIALLSSINLGYAVSFKKKFEILGSKFQFNSQIKVYPMALGFSAPGYSSVFDNSNTSGFFLPHRYQHFQTSFYLNLPTGKRFVNRRYTISYNWNFANLALGQGRNLVFGNHQFGIIGYLNKIK